MVDLLVQASDRVARRRLPVALVVAAGCYVLLLAIGSRLLSDPDTYWQIALGDWIVGHGEVPHVDTFSATMIGTPWISSQWLAQVLFAQAYSAAGWPGVVVLSAAAIATAQYLLTRFLLDRLATTPALVLSVGGFVLASPHLLARAHVLALPLMVAWIGGLIRALDDRRAPPFALLPLMALWANLHGGFTFGIFFIAPVALEALLHAAPADRVRVMLRWIGFGLLAVAAACLTPYGPESILVTRRILGLGHALALIGEWRPQDFSSFATFELCLLLGIGFALYRGLTMPPIRVLMLLGLVHMALAHTRNSEMLGLLGPLVVASPLALQVGRRESETHSRLSASWPASLALVFALAIASVAMGRLLDYRPNPLMTPSGAVAAIKASGKTRVLNSYDFGGYLIASGLAPFIDGRTELYGESFFVRHDRAISLQDVSGFLRLLRDNNIDVTLLRPQTPAVGLLDHLKGWSRLYTDDIAVVHVRTGSVPKDAEVLQ
jgi:hypothetical protein